MDLSSLSHDQLLALKSQLDGLTDTSGRSPIHPRQLHDLRLAPTATDPRPMFVWSADGREFAPGPGTLYPKLLWHRETGAEVTVTSRVEEQALEGEYTPTYTPANAATPMDAVQAAFDALSPEDQTIVLEAQRQSRIQDVAAKLSGLSEKALAQVLTAAEPKKRKKSA